MDDLEFQNLMDKVSFFKFRGIIICVSLEEIVKSIETLETYNALLDTIDFTLYHDQNFFLLRNFSSKTLSILKECSIKFSTNGKVREKENCIIGDINSLCTVFDKETLISDYFKLERNLRLKLPNTDKEVYRSMAGDYNIMFQITKAIDIEKSIENVDPRQFIESTDFFLASIPEFYCGYPDAISASLDYLKSLPRQKEYLVDRGIHKIKRKLKNF